MTRGDRRAWATVLYDALVELGGPQDPSFEQVLPRLARLFPEVRRPPTTFAEAAQLVRRLRRQLAAQARPGEPVSDVLRRLSDGAAGP